MKRFVSKISIGLVAVAALAVTAYAADYMVPAGTPGI